MAKWKLSRLLFGDDVFEFSEGDKVTIGRGLDNTITLSSLVISRNHCLIDVKKDDVSITDLKSANGIYVGLKKIPPNVPFSLTEADEIGLGWADGACLAKVEDDQKYVFKLEKCFTPIPDRIKFQDDVLDIIEAEIAAFDAMKTKPKTNPPSPVVKPKLQLKRKLDIKFESNEISTDTVGTDVAMVESGIINIISDSETETNTEQESATKKIKLEPDIIEIKTTCETEDFQCEAFNVKQEYFSYNEEPVEINSDSDSDSEHWIRRLSQTSPGKPLKNESREKKTGTDPADGSYSQVDDIFEIADDEDEDEFEHDIISIPLVPPVDHVCNEDNNSGVLPKETSSVITEKRNIESENIIPGANLIEFKEITVTPNSILNNIPTGNNSSKEVENVTSYNAIDIIDKMNFTINTDITGDSVTPLQKNNDRIIKRAQIIQPLSKKTKRISHTSSHKRNVLESPPKHSHKSTKAKKRSPSPKKKIPNSKKEERKKKLKEIACKDKDVDETSKDIVNNTSKPVINVKVTSSNRGAFLTDVNQATVKPTKRKNSPFKEKEKTIEPQKHKSKATSVKFNISNKFNKPVPKYLKEIKNDCEQKKYEDKSESSLKFRGVDSDSRIPFKSLKPLTESEESCLGKPVSIVEPLPPEKPKKSVTFSNAPPEVYEFEIEPGNKMRKTSLVRTTLMDAHNTQPSLEKSMLLKILRWNPHWLIEQMSMSEPPPILSHRNAPMAVLHSFKSHKDYVGVIGDLLLMEIWECITQVFNTNKENKFQFRIETCPWEPSLQDRHIQFTNMSVNLSLPSSEFRRVPRIGDILILDYGPENDRCSRFAYVHNTRQLPSPPINKNAYFSILLNVAFTDKMRMLKPGGEITGRSLGYIKNELMLFEAIEYMKSSPLREAILRPEPEQYPRNEINYKINLNSPWTEELNPSQKLAVSNSVSAALGDRPSVQMVQGPPGTGKSSVICAIVMTYFYDASGKKQQNRDKILICATSNAAVDGLVIRLLKIRQELPKSERFRMVRVGRLESMHERAADVSSQRLAQRDAERAQADGAHAGASEEISRLEAKINMWKTAQRDAKNPERAAYCQGRVTSIQERLALIRSGNGGASGPVAGERLVQAERRTIEGADIIVTTLASAHNYKMKGLKGRIALCVVDEAGQAIEPETLIPLTLDVTRLTLVGDPQQLPGYICSQRAKKHGLGESLFARLSSCAEQWAASPVVLLERQYRMHGAIAEYPNRAFYDGRVRSEPPPATSLAGPPYLVLGIASGDKGQVSGANEMEAWGVARLAAALAREARARRLSLAVITPYAAHRDLLRRLLDSLQHAPGDARVEVNTVDSFQGQERDVVVVSLARSSGVGFLTDAGRMNVMLTRARHQLVVCLNPMAFVRNNQWQTLIDDARRRNLYRTLPNKFCQPSTPGPASSDNILNYVFNPQ